jgi:outer membrane biosynthesis protein TonB
MDFIKAVGIIRKDLDEVSALLDQLSEIPGTHIAEIELARSRVHSATEMLKLLPRLNELPVPQPAHKEEPAKMVQQVVEVQTDAKPEVVDDVKAEVKAEQKPEVKVEVKAQPKPEVKAEAAAEKGKPILADKFSAADTIGEKTTSVRQDEAITSALHSKPISDIGAAIGINDKFYFIRELFSGDSRAYQDTIKRLNSSASLGEAMKILDENTVMGSDPSAQSSFVDVVRRKFNINV